MTDFNLLFHRFEVQFVFVHIQIKLTVKKIEKKWLPFESKNFVHFLVLRNIYYLEE